MWSEVMETDGFNINDIFEKFQIKCLNYPRYQKKIMKAYWVY